MEKNVLINKFDSNYIICDLYGENLFRKFVFDPDPYPSKDSNDFKALTIKFITYENFNTVKNIEKCFNISLTNRGKNSHVTLVMKSDIINHIIGEYAWISLELTGKYGLCLKIKINIFINDLYIEPKQQITLFKNKENCAAILTFGYTGDKSEVVASTYTKISKYRFKILNDEGVYFKDKFNQKMKCFEAILSDSSLLINECIYVEGDIDRERNAQIKVLVIPISNSRQFAEPKEVRTGDLNYVSTDEEKLIIKVINKETHPILQEETKVHLFDFELENEGGENSDIISLSPIEENHYLSYTPSNIPQISPGCKQEIKVFLKPGTIKCIEGDNESTSVCFKHDGVIIDTKKISFVKNSKVPADTTDISIELKGKELFEVEIPRINWYPDQCHVEGVVIVRTLGHNVQNLHMRSNNIIFSDSNSSELIIKELIKHSEHEYNVEFDIDEYTYDKNEILAFSDYSLLVEKGIDIIRHSIVKSSPQITNYRTINTTLYIGGNSKDVISFTIQNQTNGEENPARAEYLDLSKLRVCDIEGNDLKVLSIKRTDGEAININNCSLSPMSRENLVIRFEPNDCTEELETKIVLYFGDTQLDNTTRKINIKKRELRPIPNIVFESLNNCKYQPVDFNVGKFIIPNNSTNNDRYFERTDEKIVISENQPFYFLLDETETKSIDISNKNIKKEHLLYVKSEEIQNQNYEINIPVYYTCKQDTTQNNINGIIHIQPLIKEPELEILYKPHSDNKEIGITTENAITINCICDENTQIESVNALTLILRNKEKIAYEEKGITIEKISIKENKKETNVVNNIQILNGANDFFLPINVTKESLLNKKCEVNITIEYIINKRRNRKSIRFDVSSQIVYTDGWFSLDFGTSGIVMAQLVKQANESLINLIKIKDAEKDKKRCVEKDEYIITSSVILNSNYELCLCPSKMDFKKAFFQMVPVKFIIGQEHLPFIEKLNNVTRHNVVKIDNKEYKTNNDYVLPTKIIDYVYKDIFERRIEGDFLSSIRRLILTYPNTYVPKQLSIIKDNLLRIPSLRNKPLLFVPESDAIVAHYLKMRLEKKGFEIAIKNGIERVIIYDMGAGTLDISYVEIIYDSMTNRLTASIKNRIGAPLGGNFLDALLYDYFKDKIKGYKDETNNDPNHNNDDYDRKEREKLLNIRDFIWYVKKFWAKESKIFDVIDKAADRDEQLNVQMDDKYRKLEFHEILSSDSISKYIELCTSKILSFVLESVNKTVNDVDTLVLSGRASRFIPIKEKLNTIFNEHKMDSNTIENDLKTGVAKGAIEYMQFIENPLNYQISIENQNQYLRIGIIYKGLNEYKCRVFQYVEIINPTCIHWSDIVPENGTRYSSFDESRILDLRMVCSLRFVQTPMTEKDINSILNKPEDDNWCFVNELFTISVGNLTNPSSSKLSVHMDNNNEISIKIDDNIYRPLSGLEKIENNRCYAKSAWPFN